ncbi:aspartate kinase [Ornithinimicrobium cryptoxanthini]|uniref:Aspartokinase n=1 Tax=Ornithinimicrobium cryptoxanthini TaxID=2934161 RepID=A0ABY4YFJ9_9MICO|nr:aspartate kinase [Ornithinimicrobium cryptoxanthini]USQ75377.1 aspartate kinase [Ornithinimicrobium cryptoxanthini]
MTLLVQKFGGSSVSDVDAIRRVAQRVVATRESGASVAVVVSAMGDTTDDLLDLASQVSPNGPAERELDMLLTAGERISMALLAMAISDLGTPARSFTGQQAGMRTDSSHGRARLLDVTPARVAKALQRGEVAIVAGFQGVSDEEDITTLGRGGSDTTAVALAAALNADVCEIYTDVDGLYTADPRIVPSASRVTRITIEETLEMAAHGAKILHLRAVEYARRFGVPLHVRSSFSDQEGTWILVDRPLTGAQTPGPTTRHTPHSATDPRPSEDPMEDPIISGIAHDRSLAKVTVVGIPDRPGGASQVIGAVATAGVNIDMIVQNVSTSPDGLSDISFTLPEVDGAAAVAALRELQHDLGMADVLYTSHVGKLSLIGAGLRSNPAVAQRMFTALAEAGINIEMISTSEIRISVITDQDVLEDAVRAVHSAFRLDAEAEAVIYGGTGR